MEMERVRVRVLPRPLIAALAGCAVLGGALMLLPPDRPAPASAPAPGPAARAELAVAGGVSAALPDLRVFIGDREAYVGTHARDGQAWAQLGSAYVERGRRTADAADFPRAERALRTSLKVRPAAGGRNAEGLVGMAALANARRDFPAARTWGEAALRQAPKRWTSYPALLDAYSGLGDYRAVRRMLERLQGLRSGTAVPAVTARAAGVYRDRGWREDAQAALSDAAARAATPAEEAEWQYRAGELAWERGEPADALRHFEAALRLDPGLSSARAGEGRALAALGRTREAAIAYRAALAKQPSPHYALELGELYDSLGRPAEAQAQYAALRARVAKEQLGGVDGELLLGRFEADHGDAGSAVRRLRAEWARQPGLDVADALGWAMHRAGRSEEALAWAKRTTDKEHGAEVRSALYVYHRGMIERESGLTGPARRHLEEALRINPYFSPVGGPAAKEALAALGEPVASGSPN
ncbi:tetratricopeptide repeat protein [Streptomyces sp. SID12501]|uniref:Tetratricopeptide repeat protein n=1 Tax=Streptomyces sp. SID12501 TaxID=2706042 RepID=A0A6B3BZV9_9ACTN|nr:tetratricopeptide repeat protein [Streptomyces sp. SID12501]NEC89670.1 tetratricopeptide repeat protein [Streptomyces sp. SID12501]